ncbi:MAG: DUF2855 family protein [Solirubrobacterales bacterium]
MDFLVKRDNLHECRVEESAASELVPGQARLGVSAFGFTSNNVTYAVFGEAMSYWDFFPAEDGWGRLPAWGFAEVVETASDEVGEGTRVFGYLPMSSELVVAPARGGGGFVDASPHRSELPPAYNGYRDVATDPAYDARHEDEHMLFFPLFYTSFLIDDFLADSDSFGAEAIVLSSASSKTALGVAFLLARREGIEVIGLTSAANTGFVEGLGYYDRVLTYDAVDSLPAGRAVYVDMSGNGTVREAVHRHYGDRLAHSAVVGDTHWDNTEGGGGELPGAPPTFFFAPDRITVRTKEWGTDGLEARFREAWRPFVEDTGRWLEVVHGEGPEAVERVYRELLEGRTDPSVGHVLSLPS